MGLPTRSLLPELPALDDTDIGGPPLIRTGSENVKNIVNPLLANMRYPEVTEDCMTDPLSDDFYRDVWNQVAENNTKIYRQVFRCMPDSEVLDWKAYEKFNEYNEAFMQSQGLGNSKPKPAKDAPGKSGPVGAGGSMPSSPSSDKFPASQKGKVDGLLEKLRPGGKASNRDTAEQQEGDEKEPRRDSPDSPESGISSGPTAVPTPDPTPLDEKDAAKQENPPMEDNDITRQRTVQYSDNVNLAPETTAFQTGSTPLQHSTSQKRRRRGTTKSSARPLPDDLLGKDEAEELLKQIQGTLVLWPYDW
jgi:phospholipase D1/2